MPVSNSMGVRESFSVWLRRRRRSLDLTQKQLADRVGCSNNTIRKFEAGERIPSRDLAQLLAQNLGVPSEETEWFISFARGKTAAKKSEPPKTAGSPVTITPNNLPAALTSLIGREEDIAAVCRAVTQPEIRLLTLTGPGGTGKTSLGLEAGRLMSRQMPPPFPDGIILVELAEICDPALVLPVIAAALGLKEERSQPTEAALVEYLRPRRQLLILDNFEQVVEAAEKIVDLLKAAPDLRLLVTSRTILNVYGEGEYPVTSLALPDPGQELSPEALLAYPPVKLFVQRAQAAKPSFRVNGDLEPVVDLCRRLDGLPLAIELAAARCKFLSPNVLLAQLRGRLDLLSSQSRQMIDRQRTLKGAIEWSYNLLTPNERRLFIRLAVFAGEFSLKDAEAVVGEPAGEGLLEQLLGLVGNSVLQQVETAETEDPFRFRFLLTIREYALEQLAASGEADLVRDHHAAHFLSLAEEAQKNLMQAGQLYWLRKLDRSMDNLRAALAWLLAPTAGPDRQRNGARMVSALYRFWDARGHLQEISIWTDQALAHRAILSPKQLISLLHLSTLLSMYHSEYNRAQQQVSEALVLARQQKQPEELATTLHFAGMVAGQLGNYEEADTFLSEALSLERQAGPKRLANLSIVQNNLAVVAGRLGQFDRAITLLEESLQLKKSRDDWRAVATSLSTMGDLYHQQGNYEKAASCLRESLAIRTEINDRVGLVHSLKNMAALDLALHDYERAITLYAAADALRQTLQMTLTPVEQEEYQTNLRLLQERTGQKSFAVAWEAGFARPLVETVALVSGDWELGQVFAGRDY